MGERMCRRKVDMQYGAAIVIDKLAQWRRQGINQAAFDTMTTDDEFALTFYAAAVGAGQYGGDGLYWRAGKASAQMITPGHIKSAIGRAQWACRDTLGGEQWHPCAIRAQTCPTATTECQYRRAGGERDAALCCREYEFASTIPAQPPVTQMKMHSALA